MGTILIKAISLILIIVIGFAIKRAGWVNAGDFPKFSKIVIRITVPCILITNFNNFNITYSLIFITAAGIVINLIQQLTGYILNRNNNRNEQAFSILNIGSYNVGAFAIPFISGFLGPEPVAYASLFDMGNTISAAGIGYGWAVSLASGSKKTTVGSFLKKMFSSWLFDTYIFIIIIRVMDLRLPDAVINFTTTVGNANTFLAMLMIGIGLELHLDRKKLKKAFKYLGTRYLFAIIFTTITAFFIPFPKDIKTVLCMLFFSPIAVMATGFTSDIDGDIEISSFMISVSIIVGIITMPAIYALMS